jgi:hypothetical protein
MVESRVLEIPGKIFLIGEYLAIEGGPSVVETLCPPYRFRTAVPESATRFHPDSPAGRLLAERQEEGVSIERLEGPARPGFGGSTAECIAAWFLLNPDSNGEDLLGWYRSRFPGASGADLRAQVRGWRNGPRERKQLPPVYSRLHLFERSDGSKLPTHEDLRVERSPIDRGRLSALVEEFIERIEAPHSGGFSVLTAYATELSRTGRESGSARAIRLALEGLDGVEGVKGCGAGLHDHFLIALRTEADFPSVSTFARTLGLVSGGSLLERAW